MVGRYAGAVSLPIAILCLELVAHVDNERSGGPAIPKKGTKMTALSKEESVKTVGGEPISFGTALLLAGFSAAAYVGKDIYDNWSEFKAAVADGWNNNR